MLKSRSSSREDGGKTAVAAVTAAALQDHIVRSLPHLHSLSLSGSTQRTAGPASSSRAQKTPNGQTQEEEKEYVLDPDPPPLTLAQRLGLVEAPARRLTIKEWSEVKTRSVQEGDSTQPCAICREEFCLQPQVCLKSFERFSGRKCCPMCRIEQYETRVIHDGARLYREKCAIRIQACWRGFAARKWYRNMRKLVPPKDPALRRRFFEAKLQDITDRLVRYCCTDVEALLSEVDRNLAASREVSHLLDQHLASRHGNEGEEEWMEVQEKALQRDVSDCPICLAPLYSSGTGLPASRRVILLSCSHLFHESCLQCFERFCFDKSPTCPLCRRHYTTRPV